MESELLQHLLSFENKANRRYGADFPIYKFHRLYEDRRSLSEEERQSLVFVENETKTGFHVLNRNLVALLREHAIWFSPASQFNDPWDAGAGVSVLRTNASIQEPVLKALFGEAEFGRIALLADAERYGAIEERLREVFRVLRFACFSKRYDSNPMWAHYADNHRGVCLQFRFMRRLPAGAAAAYAMDPSFTGHYLVRYSEDFTRVADVNDIGSAVQVLHTKHPDWAYEQEVRFIKMGDAAHPDKGGTIPFYKSSLRKVILGCKVPAPLWRAVEVLLDEFGYEHTMLLRSEFDSGTQTLQFQEKKRRKGNAAEAQ
jgi:hypothetical protein